MLICNSPDVAAWVANNAKSDPRVAQATIGWTHDGKIVCGVSYEQFTKKSITASMAIAPGTIVPKLFMHAIFDYPFNKLGVEKIIAFVAASNTKSVTALEKMGFCKETSIADYYEDGDMLVYSMLRTQCKWIGEHDGQE